MTAEQGRATRTRPNLLVTGTPGTGKTSTCSLLASATGLRHINVGELVKEKSLHDGWNAELDCYIVNDDLVCIFRNPRLMVAATDPCMHACNPSSVCSSIYSGSWNGCSFCRHHHQKGGALISCSDVCEVALPLSLHFVEGDYGPAAAVAQLSFFSYHHDRREKHTLLSCFMFCELALPLPLCILMRVLIMGSTIELLYTSWKRRACLVA